MKYKTAAEIDGRDEQEPGVGTYLVNDNNELWFKEHEMNTVLNPVPEYKTIEIKCQLCGTVTTFNWNAPWRCPKCQQLQSKSEAAPSKIISE